MAWVGHAHAPTLKSDLGRAAVVAAGFTCLAYIDLKGQRPDLDAREFARAACVVRCVSLLARSNATLHHYINNATYPTQKKQKKTNKKHSIPRVQALGQGLCLLPWIAAGIAFAFLGFDDVLQFFGIDDHWLNTPVYVCVLYGQATPLPYRYLVTSGTLIVPPRNGGRGNVSSRTPVEVALCCSFYADCAIPMTSCNRKDLLRQYSGC